MPTVSFVTLGCRVNQYDTQALRDRAADAGYREAPFPGAADVVVVNACTVTEAADAEVRFLLRKARRLNPSSLVVLAGCLPEDFVHPPTDGSLADLVVGNSEKHRLFEKVAALRGREGPGDNPARDPWVGGIRRFKGHQRAIVKVQEGCPFACSFCRVPQVRGRAVSRPQSDILAEAKRLAGEGVKEIVLTGIQLASYGRDAGMKASEPRLTRVVEGLLAVEGIRRVRLSSYSIADFEEPLLAFLGRGLCPHLHLPLQSGDPGVLKAMRRPYTLDAYRTVVGKVRHAAPRCGITTDLIAGFPGESDGAFARTVEAVHSFGFTDIHPFPYSARPGTSAEGLPEAVPDKELRRRMETLLALKGECLEKAASAAKGRPWTVVAERGPKGFLAGTTETGLKVTFPAGDLSPGMECRVGISGFNGGRALGEVISYVPK